MEGIRDKYVRDLVGDAYSRGYLAEDGTLAPGVLRRAGVDRSTWWRWRNNVSAPTTRSLAAVYRAMDEMDSEAEAAG